MTWNINSLRLRLPGLAEIVKSLDPDLICLQEIKVEDALFPLDGVKALGYQHVLHRGMKAYNGVAIFSKRIALEPLPAPDWCARGDCRHVAARLDLHGRPVDLHNFYVPAGGDIPDRDANPKFGHKLDFLAEATEWFARAQAAGGAPDTPGIIVGDLNIAPLECDVWSHKQLLDVVSHTPVEVAALGRWQAARGFVDAVRHFVPAPERLYSWWSYRARDWEDSDRGRRLDHIWVSPDLAGTLRAAHILKAARGIPLASDHVPVVVDLKL
ncbi:MAG: exodeoxyribonuclease III [Alphaproteobacteria bacterium]|nr:exodeoxyribonuclease III [Alphaproteobacteria bacterium]